MSKVVERSLAELFLPWLERYNRLSVTQYAYRRGKGYRDVLLVNVCSWLVAFEQRRGVLLYCSDVSGAFDRVPTDRLLQKLFLSGINPKVFLVLANWLRARKSAVVVNGSQSVWSELSNQVYQGTVLGPPLWNVYFRDIEALHCGTSTSGTLMFQLESVDL